MSSYFNKKRVLVTGGTGLIGIPLVKRLLKTGAGIRVASLDEKSPFGSRVEFMRVDLCDKRACDRAMKDMQIVFHLAGIKGGIGLASSKAASFLVKNILINTLVMEAARRHKVDRFLYASSICIYPPARIFVESSAGTGLPHPSDRFGGMAKLVGEMQIEAYRLQYGLENFFIARPVNTYGPYDNFDPVSGLIIPALITRVFNGENPLVVWGNGSAVRDFIFSEDAADFIMLMVEKNASGPYNVGSAKGWTIKQVAQAVCRQAKNILHKNIVLKWDIGRAAGEPYRVASMQKASEELGWQAPTGLDEGIRKTMVWYKDHRRILLKRHSILCE